MCLLVFSSIRWIWEFLITHILALERFLPCVTPELVKMSLEHRHVDISSAMTTYLKPHSRQMDVEYRWILWQEKNCSQFRLLFPFSFNNQIIYPVWGKGGWGRGVRYLYSLRTLHLFTFFTSLPMTVHQLVLDKKKCPDLTCILRFSSLANLRLHPSCWKN